MKVCLQRVLEASVTVNGKIVGKIDKGLLIFIGFEKGDNPANMVTLRDKIINLRIFRNDEKHMDKSLKDTGDSVLIVSQFTLAGNCTKGRRPDFTQAMPPVEAENFYTSFVKLFEDVLGAEKVSTGVFGADMLVSLTNDGPVTFVVEK